MLRYLALSSTSSRRGAISAPLCTRLTACITNSATFVSRSSVELLPSRVTIAWSCTYCVCRSSKTPAAVPGLLGGRKKFAFHLSHSISSKCLWRTSLSNSPAPWDLVELVTSSRDPGQDRVLNSENAPFRRGVFSLFSALLTTNFRFNQFNLFIHSR